MNSKLNLRSVKLLESNTRANVMGMKNDCLIIYYHLIYDKFTSF